MDDDATRTRRRFIASALGLAGAASIARVAGPRLFGSHPIEAAHGVHLTGAATAGSPAVRLGPPPSDLDRPPAGRVAFPIDPGPSCTVLDNFGDCRSNGTRAHEGVDILDAKGRTIFAVCDGTIVQQYVNDGTAGNGWAIRGDDAVRYSYLHLDAFAPGLAVGSRVSFGDVIGTVGSTGTGTTTNNHLHFEVRPITPSAPRGTPVDPFPLLLIPPGVRTLSNPEYKDCEYLL